MFDEGGLSFGLRRDSPYSFKCQRCGVCCNNKRIVPSPDERARLAAFLSVDEERFSAEYLDPASDELRLTKDGDCIFLSPEGCRVHPARPLVCRLFPLGVLKDEAGNESFGIMPLHPDCLGMLGTDGTVEEDLKTQGAEVRSIGRS